MAWHTLQYCKTNQESERINYSHVNQTSIVTIKQLWIQGRNMHGDGRFEIIRKVIANTVVNLNNTDRNRAQGKIMYINKIALVITWENHVY